MSVDRRRAAKTWLPAKSRSALRQWPISPGRWRRARERAASLQSVGTDDFDELAAMRMDQQHVRLDRGAGADGLRGSGGDGRQDRRSLQSSARATERYPAESSGRYGVVFQVAVGGRFRFLRCSRQGTCDSTPRLRPASSIRGTSDSGSPDGTSTLSSVQRPPTFLVPATQPSVFRYLKVTIESVRR